MKISDFLAAPDERWHDIPNTSLLQASSYGRIRNANTMEFFGEIRIMEDLGGILDGSIPPWSTDSVLATPAPRSYWKHRGRHDRADEEAFLYAEAA